MDQFKKILVGVDLDHEGYQHLLSRAAGVAACAGAEVEVIYVCPDYRASPLLEGYLDSGVIDQAVVGYREKLDALVQEIIPDTVPCQLTIGQRKGHNAYQFLTKHAEETGADLIIIGEHDRHGFDHIWLGSNAEKVVRYAPCTVMVIKRKA